MRTMHLFAGVGGGLLADLILGHTPIVAVEWDAYACQVLRERAAEGWFPELQVWEGDVRLFDPSKYAGKVDCIHAGFPCQDISVAGNQAGVGHETRSGLYREVLRIAGIVRPRYLFLENVAAILGNGLSTVLADLAAMGFSAEWGCIRASDCGAPHHRDRWFLLADAGRGRRGESGFGEDQFSWRTEVIGASEAFSDADDKRELQPQRGDRNQRGWPSNIREDVSNSNDERRQKLDTAGIAAIPEWDGGITNAGRDSSWWAVESLVGRVANGIPNRIYRIKGLGNAQVPLQAAVAWRLLGGE